LFRRLLNVESGYSLVEVMVSIIILAIAILPMVGMFDMGLRSATAGSNYDKARALANLKMEEAKSLPFATVRDDFPVAGTTFTAGYYDSGFIAETGPASADFTNFEYRVEKRYMAQPNCSTPSCTNPQTFATSGSATSPCSASST
jgi:prepilin-type N-terminal cleavage/methylation domain-containing protein